MVQQEEGRNNRRLQFTALTKDLEEQFLSHETQREESFCQEEAQQSTTSRANEHERNRQLSESEAGRERAFQRAQEMRLTKSDWYAKTRDELIELNRQARNRGCNELEAEMKSRFNTILHSQRDIFTKEHRLYGQFLDALVSSIRVTRSNRLTSYLAHC